MDDFELQYMREERQRALNPSAFDRGFEEGNSSMDDWGNTSGGDAWGNSSGGDAWGNSSGGDAWGNSSGGDAWGNSSGGDAWGNSSGGDVWGNSSGGDAWGNSSSGDVWGNSVSSDPWGNTSDGNVWGGGGSFSSRTTGGAWTPQSQMQQPQQSGTDEFEDKVFNGVVNGGKAVVNAMKESGKAARTFGLYNARGMGKQLIITGGICVFLGALSGFLNNSLWVHYITGGIVSVAVGVPLMMMAQDRIEKEGMSNEAPADAFSVSPEQPVNELQSQQQGVLQGGMQAALSQNTQVSQNPWGDWDESDDGTGSSDSFAVNDNEWSVNDDTNFNMGSADTDDTVDLPDWSNEVDDTAFETGNIDTTVEQEPVDINDDEPVDVEALVSNIDVPRGVMTRQFIFERVTKVLKHVTKNFADFQVLDEGSAEFDMWLEYLNEAVDSLKAGADTREARPVLVSVKKKLFYYLLEINNRGVKGIKMDKLISELVSLYAYDKDTNKLNPAVYGSGNSSGSMFYIKIMRGESVSVSVEDLLMARSDFFLDTKNEMPCALGLDIDGDPVLVDMVDVNALLITGEPRSGKSWALRNIMIQLMMFGSPRDVCFYICDPKDSISDYIRFKSPHIRRFESQDAAILETLRELVKVEGPRRKQVLSDAGCYKIQEYREQNPNVDFPYIYVLIDEIVTLAERMDKETKQEFQGLMMELVTQFPATGLRLVLVPHIVKDDIIKKSISQNMPCRISVRGNTEHIELCTGMKCGTGEGQFPYKLAKVGDMAVNLKAGNDMIQKYVHSAVVGTTSEASDAAFDFVDALWRGIEGIDKDEELRVTRGSAIGGTNKLFANNSVSQVSVVEQSSAPTKKGKGSRKSNTQQSTSAQSEQSSGFTYTVEDNVAEDNTVVDNTQGVDSDMDFVDYDESIW